jgi:hypothetical protein
MSTVGFHDAEICVADRSSDYVPVTDHRGIAAHIQVDPLDGLQPSQVKFTHHDLSGFNTHQALLRANTMNFALQVTKSGLLIEVTYSHYGCF